MTTDGDDNKFGFSEHAPPIEARSVIEKKGVPPSSLGTLRPVPAQGYLDKIVAILSVEPANLWTEFGEASRYVKQLAEIEWDLKVQWTIPDDAVGLHAKKEKLIQILCLDYPEIANRLWLQPNALEQSGSSSVVGAPPTNGHRRRKARGESHFTRSARKALIRAVNASGLEICRSIDEDGVVSKDGRNYEGIYQSDPRLRKQLDSRFSKIKRKMKTEGLI